MRSGEEESSSEEEEATNKANFLNDGPKCQ